MSKSRIDVIQGPTLRGSIKTVVGVIPVETLVRHHAVPKRDVLRGIGYQRMPSPARVNDLATSITKRVVDLPTSVLLSLRGSDHDQVLTRVGPDRYEFTLDPEKASDEHRLFVVDGQHRVKALEKALNEDYADIRNVKIPFVCLIGADEAQEMEQFHVVNSNAKSVPTDLALDLLRALSQQDPSFAQQLEERGRKWELDAQGLTQHLATASGTWETKIRLANSPKGQTTVPSASFVKSLKPLLAQPTLFRRIPSVEQQGQIIDAYWRAIQRILPKAFEDPAKFSIQKGIGVDAMHAVLPNILDQVRTAGNSIFEPESYQDLVSQALLSIEAPNGEGNVVTAEDFWRTGRRGAAGTYSSAAGRRRLAELIEARLPEPVL
jgi:DGQHR domain-containing protein